MRHENRLISLIIRHSGIVIREEEARNRLPAAIRVVIGCVEVTEADIGSSDVLEVAPEEGMVRAIRCDDATKALPVVTEIVEIDLRSLRRKKSRLKGTILYLKGRYITFDDPARTGQRSVDEKLIKAGIVTPEGVGPDAAALVRLLNPTPRSTST